MARTSAAWLVPLTLLSACLERLEAEFYVVEPTTTSASSSGEADPDDTSTSTGGSSSTAGASHDGDHTAEGSSEAGGADTTSTSDTDTSGVTSEPPAVCGDGVVDRTEECDAGLDTADCAACRRSRLIFVTSKLLAGDMGGLVNADANCKSLALKAQQEVPGSPIVDPGNFLALISSSTASIADRHFIGQGPYRLVNGITVAHSFADLFDDDPLLAPIDVDERSQTQVGSVWTGTAVDGSPYPGIDFCGDWDDLKGTSTWGASSEVDGGWIHVVHELNPEPDCLTNRPIYCAEQE
jgi:hypothetical protein